MEEDITFKSNGTAFLANDPEDVADWDYVDGALVVSENPMYRFEIPDRISFPSTVPVTQSSDNGDGKGAEGKAITDVTFDYASMTMKVAEYLDPAEGAPSDQGETVTCRK